MRLVSMAALLLLAAGAEAAEQRAVIPLHARPGPSGFANIMTVAVGGGAPANVLFDTGSNGLRIRAEALGPDVRLTDIPITYSYTSGNVLKGVLGYARVAFPGSTPAIATPREIAIQVVQSVSCKPDKPECPGWPKSQAGVLGAAYNPTPIFNPLAQLEGRLADGFIVVADDLARPGLAPHVIVGPDQSDLAGFSFAPFDAWTGGGQPDGLRAWNTKSVRTCFSVDNGPEGCHGTVFDTGAGNGSFEVPDHPVGGTVRPGRVVTTRVPEAGMSLTVTAGTERWANRYRFAPPHGSVKGHNSGGLVFRHMQIAFDAVNGRIGFRRP